MKKLRFLSIASIAALMLGACSEDKFVEGVDAPDTPADNGDGVYFTVNINLPNAVGGRSFTDGPDEGSGSSSNSGVEIGQDYENTISEAVVVLAQNSGNGFIAAATISSGDLIVGNADKTMYTAKSKFTKTQLAAFYETQTGTQPIATNVFLFCNPTQDLRDAIFGSDTKPAPTVGTNDWLNAAGTVDNSSPIWTPNYFMMSNALIAKREIPGTIEAWNNYTKEDNPFHLSGNNNEASINNLTNGGAIKVERTAARFDFRDGANDGAGAFTYHVVLAGANDAMVENEPLIDITLQKMAMVNVGKAFYFLPHMIGANEQGVINTIDDASMKAGVCTPELPWYSDETGTVVAGGIGNYVLDADYAWKQTVNENTTSGFADKLLYPFFNEDGTIDNSSINNDRWATSLCSEVVQGTDNITDGWEATNKDYKIWRYATENTIPSVEGQVYGVTTGVVFKGKMVATDNALNSDDAAVKEMAETINNKDNNLKNSYTDPILYLFDGNLYMTWENVRKAAIAAAQPTFKFVPAEDYQISGEGEWVLETINRTNSLYIAVFGKEGGCGSFTFTPNGESVPVTIDDTLAEKTDCANAAWNAWDEGGRPASGTLTDGFKAAVTGAGFTIYQSSYDPAFGWGYYCYYYYWNRHNYNGNAGVMGPMEFGVVRNNVYKLAVTKIKQLGHPRISANDPDKPKPGSPDESENVYIDVQAEVLPWVVRVNNIEF